MSDKYDKLDNENDPESNEIVLSKSAKLWKDIKTFHKSCDR